MTNSRDIKYKRHAIREHKNRIWLVIRRFVITNDVLNGYSMYDYLNYLKERDRLDSFSKESTISSYEKDIAIRFIIHAIKSGNCDSSIEKIDFTVCDNWLNDEIVLQHIYSNFLNYWDEAILSYKSSKAKSKRITYLIEKLNEDLLRTEIKQYANIQQQIKNLIRHYEELIAPQP